MKKFLTQFLLFAFPIFIVAYFFDIFISDELRKSNSFAISEYSSWNVVLDGKVDSDVVIYGSSRSWLHVNPMTIGDSLGLSTYNLGINGHNFWLQHLRHRLLLEKNPKPKMIIQTLDISTLTRRKDLHNPDQFLPYMLWNHQMRDAVLKYEGYKYFDFELPLIRYYGKLEALKNVLRNKMKTIPNPPVRIKGYQAKDLKWNGDLEKAKAKFKSFTTVLDEPSVKLFDKYLADCKKQHIKMVFVYTPEYIEGQQMISNRAEIMAVFERFSKKYDIPYYDYSDDPISYQRDYFYNSMHLNLKGAEFFSSKLAHRMKNEPSLQSISK